MKRITAFQCILVIVLIGTGLSLKAQDNVSVKRDVKDFDKVGFSLPGDLEIKQGAREELVLVGDQEELDKIITKVENGKLKIYRERGSIKNVSDVKAYLVVKQINELAVSGSGDIKVVSEFKADDLEIRLSGSGDIRCEKLMAETIDISVSGSGDIDAGGVVNSLQIALSGSGDIDTGELEAKLVKVSISGSGDVKVWASDELDSRISGSGSVRYKGRPVVNSSVSGSGSTRSL